MNDKEKKYTQPVQQQQTKQTQSRDVAGFYFSSSLKITDPKTGETILHKRAD